jgi:hypothetical protein
MPFTSQVTAVFGVPLTDAYRGKEPLAGTLACEGETEIVIACGEGWEPPPPQSSSKTDTAEIAATRQAFQLTQKGRDNAKPRLLWPIVNRKTNWRTKTALLSLSTERLGAELSALSALLAGIGVELCGLVLDGGAAALRVLLRFPRRGL